LAAEAVEDKDDKQESVVKMVTAADINSNSDRDSRGNDDNGGGGDSNIGKNITIN
jgi:hypothetical protein